MGTFIWLTLNQGLPIGTWLQLRGIPPSYKICESGVMESPQHYLLDCPPTQHAWEAFKRIWEDWKAPEDTALFWPFILLEEVVVKCENDPPRLHGYHVDSFSYPRQPLDILCSFLLYYLWSERCRRHFNDQYSLKKVLHQAWVAIVEVGMAT